VDNLKIGIQVLGRRRAWIACRRAWIACRCAWIACRCAWIVCCSACILTAACTTAPQTCVPPRATLHASLVRFATDDGDALDTSRNDAILGANREPIVRVIDGSTTFTYDRQQIFNGRPWDNFRVTTRARSVSQR